MSQQMNFASFDDFFKDMNPKKVSETKSVKDNNVVKKENVDIKPVIKGVDPSILKSGQEKISKIRNELNQLFSEREDAIDILLLAIATGSNMLMLGPPGSAKSYLAYELCNRIENGNYFQWMLNKTSDPSEILGSFSIKEMEQDRFMRTTTGKLPEAHIAFLDEIYKCNSASLNALLSIMNEHIFYNDGKAQDIPLISLIGASNEEPEDDSLLALHDRFTFRINMEYIQNVDGRKRMHNNFIARRNGTLNLNKKTTISLDELLTIQKASETVQVPKDIINEFIRLINDLNRDGIHISDRRQNECIKVIQGSAVLRGSNVASYEDFRSLIYVLWEHQDELSKIKEIVIKKVNPFEDRFNDIRKKFVEMRDKIDNIDDSNAKLREGQAQRRNFERLVSKMNKLIGDCNKVGKDTADYVNFRNEITAYNSNIISSSAKAMFDDGFDGDDNPFK